MDNWNTIARRYDRHYRKIVVLSEQQNHRCCYCGVNMIIPRIQCDRIGYLPNVATIEHVQPRIKGGQRGYHNEVAACQLCNSVRSADDAIEFYHWRLKHLDKTPKQLQKAIGRYRRDKARAEAPRLAVANRSPYIFRMMQAVVRYVVELLNKYGNACRRSTTIPK
jgi:hypothetical protein